MLTIILGFLLAASFMLALMKCAGKQEPGEFIPEPPTIDPNDNPFQWNRCPACGRTKIHVVKMTRGLIVTHDCGVPRHSQCQLDGHFATTIEAAGAWNRRVDQWINERDLTRPE